MKSGGDYKTVFRTVVDSRCNVLNTSQQKRDCKSAYSDAVDAACSSLLTGTDEAQKTECIETFEKVEQELYDACAGDSSNRTDKAKSTCTYKNFDSSYSPQRTFTVAGLPWSNADTFTNHIVKIVPAIQKAAKDKAEAKAKADAAATATNGDIVKTITDKLSDQRAKKNLSDLVDLAASTKDTEVSGNALKVLQDYLKELFKKYGDKLDILTDALQNPKKESFDASNTYKVTIKNPADGKDLELKNFDAVRQAMEKIVGVIRFPDDEKAQKSADALKNICSDTLLMVDPNSDACNERRDDVVQQILAPTVTLEDRKKFFAKPDEEISGLTLQLKKGDTSEAVKKSLTAINNAFYEKFGVHPWVAGFGYTLSMNDGLTPIDRNDDGNIDGFSSSRDKLTGKYNVHAFIGRNTILDDRSWLMNVVELSAAQVDPSLNDGEPRPVIGSYAVGWRGDYNYAVSNRFSLFGGLGLFFNFQGDSVLEGDGHARNNPHFSARPEAGLRYRFTDSWAIAVAAAYNYRFTFWNVSLENITAEERATDASLVERQSRLGGGNFHATINAEYTFDQLLGLLRRK